ncbi:unnamed protein product [Acidithrix sp. C25]|nr:unnamed protein product [Acidithrix sp. C25]
MRVVDQPAIPEIASKWTNPYFVIRELGDSKTNIDGSRALDFLVVVSYCDQNMTFIPFGIFSSVLIITS